MNSGPQDPSPMRPLTLTGTMLVRNVTYQKTVAVRFTMDDWHTTNDVVARHEKSLAALPGRFVRGASGALDPTKERVCSPYAVDSIGYAAVPIGDAPAWDRFRFDINLEDYAIALETRTMWLVGRYLAASASQPSEAAAAPAAPAEWWDNNMGSNYRVGFERKPESSEQMYKRGVIVSAPRECSSNCFELLVLTILSSCIFAHTAHCDFAAAQIIPCPPSNVCLHIPSVVLVRAAPATTTICRTEAASVCHDPKHNGTSQEAESHELRRPCHVHARSRKFSRNFNILR